MNKVFELVVKFKSGGHTKSVFFSESEVLRYVDDTIGDDYLYDCVSDWLATASIGGEDFQVYPLTISVVES